MVCVTQESHAEICPRFDEPNYCTVSMHNTLQNKDLR